MFDIGFWELGIIAIVALLVIGPEKLPEFAYGVGQWVGKIQRLVGQAKFELEREVRASELEKVIKEQEKLINHMKSDIEQQSNQLGRELQDQIDYDHFMNDSDALDKDQSVDSAQAGSENSPDSSNQAKS